MNYKQWLALKLKRIRRSKRWTQRDIAGKLQLKQPTYASYEEARAAPEMRIILKLLRLIGMSPDDFFADYPY